MGSPFFNTKNEASQFFFSREYLCKLEIFDSPEDQQVLRRGTWLEKDCRQQGALQVVMDFMQTFLMRRMPAGSHLVAVADSEMSHRLFQALRPDGSKVILLIVEMDCLFSTQVSPRVVSAGEVCIDYRMVKGEHPVFRLEQVRTDSPRVAAFFLKDPQALESVVQKLETLLKEPESDFSSGNLNRRF